MTIFRDHLQLILKTEYVVYSTFEGPKMCFWYVKKSCEPFHLEYILILISFLVQIFYQQIEKITSFDSKFFWKGKSLFSIEAARKWKEVSVLLRNLSQHFIFWDIFVLLLKHFFHLRDIFFYLLRHFFLSSATLFKAH